MPRRNVVSIPHAPQAALSLDGKPQAAFVLEEPIAPNGLTKTIELGRDFLGHELTLEIRFGTDCNSTNNNGTIKLLSLLCL